MAHHLLDRLCRVAFVHAARGLEERELEPSPDYRGHGRHLLTPRTEPVEPPGNQIPDAGGQRHRGAFRERHPQARLIERAHRLHGDEGIALAHPPDPRFHLRHRPGVAPDASERPHEQGCVGL